MPSESGYFLFSPFWISSSFWKSPPPYFGEMASPLFSKYTNWNGSRVLYFHGQSIWSRRENILQSDTPLRPPQPLHWGVGRWSGPGPWTQTGSRILWQQPITRGVFLSGENSRKMGASRVWRNETIRSNEAHTENCRNKQKWDCRWCGSPAPHWPADPAGCLGSPSPGASGPWDSSASVSAAWSWIPSIVTGLTGSLGKMKDFQLNLNFRQKQIMFHCVFSCTI